MIPSDHFVRFYNEIFKYLDEHGGLEEYFLAISKQQEHHCLERFKNQGLQGVYEYYLKIRFEENCGLELELQDGCLHMFMQACPSLAKAIDNDAGLCRRYCEHCPGWTFPVYSKAGLYIIKDLMEHDLPQCQSWLFDDLQKARCKLDELQEKHPGIRFKHNF